MSRLRLLMLDRNRLVLGDIGLEGGVGGRDQIDHVRASYYRRPVYGWLLTVAGQVGLYHHRWPGVGRSWAGLSLGLTRLVSEPSVAP